MVFFILSVREGLGFALEGGEGAHDGDEAFAFEGFLEAV